MPEIPSTIARPAALVAALIAFCGWLAACGDSGNGTGSPAAAGTSGAVESAGVSGMAAASGGAAAGATAAGSGGAMIATAGQAGEGGGSGGATSAAGGAAGIAGSEVSGGSGSTGGVNGSAGSGGNGSSSGSAGSAGSGGGFPNPASFTCNAVLGVSVTGDWFGAGFETGLNGDKWQVKWRSLGFVEQWADPTNDIWSRPWGSPCTNGSNDPDRVIFTGVNWTFKTEAEWQTQLDAVVVTLQAKYPSLKEIDLMTMLRAPGNVDCPGATTPEQVVAPYIDQAIAAVVAKHPKLVRAAPAFYAPSCDVFLPNSPHFATGEAAAVAKVIRDYYASH